VKGVARDVHHADVGGVDSPNDAHRLEAVLDEIVWVRVDPDVDALARPDALLLAELRSFIELR